MKRKFVVSVMIITLLVTMCLICFAACGGEEKPKHIKSYEDFEKYKGYGKLVLDADIDCNYESLRIGAYEFDGQGHTISNVVNSDSIFIQYDPPLTFKEKMWGRESKNLSFKVSNLNLKNITVNNENAQYLAIVLSNVRQYGSENYVIQNVHLADSQVIASFNEADKSMYVGGIYGGDQVINLVDCSVENVTVQATGPSKNNMFVEDMSVGALAGMATLNVTNCRASHCKISATSLLPLYDVNAGALIGLGADGNTFINCVASDNEVTVNANYYSRSEAIAYASTPTVYAGGIVGNLYTDNNKSAYGVLETSYAQNNKIDVSCTGDYYIGGLAGWLNGTVRQCYSAGNNFSGHNRYEDDKNDCERVIGGLAGKFTIGTVTSSFSYGNIMQDTTYEKETDSLAKEIYLGGFVGAGISVSNILQCAAVNNEMHCGSGGHRDNFGTVQKSTMEKTSCYVTLDEDYTNSAGCAVLEQDQWLGDNFKSLLNLRSTLWVFEEQKLPRLNVGSIE